MVGPPPPPPPGPPPPPMGGLKLGASMPSGGDPRNALLQSIQNGAKLKKVQTVDKSVPLIAGKVGGSVGPAAAPSAMKPSNGGGSVTNGGGGKLGGIFEGLSGMPKLKPVGSRGAVNRSPPAEAASDTSFGSNNNNNQINNSNGPAPPALDFNAELTKHLTLKRQKNAVATVTTPIAAGGNASESNLRTNRGPPPQPPAPRIISPQAEPPAVPSTKTPLAVPPPPMQQQSVESNLSSLFKKQPNSTLSLNSNAGNTNPVSTVLSPPEVKTNGRHGKHSPVMTPIRSTLFQSISTTSESTSTTPIVNAGSTNNLSSIGGRPMPNHGKPNCAPKPPGIQQIIASKNSNSNGSSGARPTVSRHHSMKTPRSPPVSLPTGPVFPTNQHLGTLRGPSQMFISQESIPSSIRQAPNPPIGRPTVAPPRPPNIKPPPPPTPIRNMDINNSGNTTSSNSNMNSSSQQHHNNSTPVNTPHYSISNNNVVSEKSPNGSAPPLPPHRTCPAPQPLRQNSNTMLATAPAAPVPPQRHSSIRSSSSSSVTSSSINIHTISTSSKQVNRLVVDLESRFAQSFHNVTEFRAPPPFTNFPKSYPSLNVKTSNGMY